jgi:hypothetical protein
VLFNSGMPVCVKCDDEREQAKERPADMPREKTNQEPPDRVVARYRHRTTRRPVLPGCGHRGMEAGSARLKNRVTRRERHRDVNRAVRMVRA